MAITNTKYNDLLETISSTLQSAKENAVKAINTELVKANWEVGRNIVEFEQQGNEKAEYGSALLANLANDLKVKFGKGFSRSNLQQMRLLYLKYPICQTLSGKLSWSHYSELLTISDELSRNFYEQQTIKENWSFREMKRQIDSALFQRLALSKDKNAILALSEKGQEIQKPSDIIKDPYIFEFLELPKDGFIKERGLEKRLTENLQKFLLELGKGFTFVAKQYKITIDNEHNFIDLVFYHRILKCFVLICKVSQHC